MTRFNFSKGMDRLSLAMSTGSKEVPFIAQMHEFSMRESGIPGDEFYTDAKKFVRGICEVSERFGFDTPSFIWDVYNIEAEALGCRLATFVDMAPAIADTSGLISSEKDLARLKAPDPYSSGRMPMVFEILQEIKTQTGMSPLPCYCAPFTLASHILSFENLIVQMQKNPSFVHKLLTFLVDEVLAPYMNALLKEFPDAPVADGSDAVASLPFITQDMLDEFALSYIERLQQQTIRPAICDNWWGDSHVTDLPSFWQQKLRATPDYLKIQDPDLYKIGTEPVVEFARNRDLPIVLGVDNNLLHSGSRQGIQQRVHEYMEAIEAVGRGALYLCSLSAVTPAENVEIAITAAKQFRQGERPWAGEHRAGSAEARGESKPQKSQQVTPRTRHEDEALLDDIFDAVLDQDNEAVPQLVTSAIEQQIDVNEVLNEGLIAAMDEIGNEFADGRIFVPEMLLAAHAMKAGLQIIRPILTETGAPPRGKILLATIQGDVHDIGKNLVGMMLEGAGYEVIDLGVNQTAEEILAKANELKPDIVGLSALLTTSMPAMRKTIDLFKGKEPRYPLLVGGAPVTQEFADAIKADGFGENAPLAVDTVNRIIAN